jgi:hypothetical protein
VEAAVNRSISRVLYEWLRLVSEVARALGADESNLSRKLRANKYRTRLSADELFPLLDAIREAGYGEELVGMLHPFLEGMRTEAFCADPGNLMAHMQKLGKGVTLLFECAARVPQMNDPDEIRKLKIQVRTEVLPVVLQMEDLLDRRLEKITKSKRVRSSVPSPQLAPQPIKLEFGNGN